MKQQIPVFCLHNRRVSASNPRSGRLYHPQKNRRLESDYGNQA
nr:MAG TPA: hypothetical protein [Caudoviricetes sp.]